MDARGGTGEQVHIDWTRCDGRGLCIELLPELLGRDDWGHPVVRSRDERYRSDIPIPERLLPAAEDAVGLCPLQALRFV